VESQEIQRVRGTNDVLPSERVAQQAALDRLQRLFTLYGYQPIDTPVLEPTDLFLRKSGEEIAARMYSFTHWNRSLCLRPEFTASVIRAYVNHLQDRPLPVRLQYAGPTFRYEKPQQVRHRQFTEVGVECIGADGPASDAEVLATARHGLEAVGLRGARFVVGHLGAVLDLLGQLGMPLRAQSLVLGSMERLSRTPGDSQQVVERLVSMLGAGEEGDDDEDGSLGDLLRSFGPEGAARIAGDLLERANFSLSGGSRSPAEIVERLLSKWDRPDPTPALERASDFIAQLRSAAGPPRDALPALRSVLAAVNLPDGPVRDVERALEYFEAYGGAPAGVEVDLSLARGLRYYTGLVFEVYDDHENQIAGGGRYDDLVRALGGRTSLPASGFSFGLERVMAALERQQTGADGAVGAAVQVLVAPVELEDYTEAARVAAELRGAGIASEVDLRFRGVKANLRYADHERIPVVAIVGERERAEGVVVVHDMGAFSEARVSRAEAVGAVQARLGPSEATPSTQPFPSGRGG
jgi:histidyl-tRNA synthetase